MQQLLIVLLLVLCNAFFAMSEMAVMTSRKMRLKQMAAHSRGARKALALAEHPESFLSAVQLWITLLSLLVGYFGGESMGAKIPYFVGGDGVGSGLVGASARLGDAHDRLHGHRQLQPRPCQEAGPVHRR